MPEGHTIHRLARDHGKHFAGQTLRVTSPQGRFADGAAEVDGSKLENVEAHGKHLFYTWEGGRRLHIHLGLYGKFRLRKVPMPEPRGQVRMRVEGDERGFDLHGPTCCELISDPEFDELCARLGPDPLRRDADPDAVWQRISGSRAALGSLLLDQSVLAGVGNVYRAEILFDLRLHPETRGRDLGRDRFDAMWSRLSEWLRIGVKYNRIITADPARFGKTLGKLRRGERLLVYKKPSCPDCETPIEAMKLANRTLYLCPACQAAE